MKRRLKKEKEEDFAIVKKLDTLLKRRKREKTRKTARPAGSSIRSPTR